MNSLKRYRQGAEILLFAFTFQVASYDFPAIGPFLTLMAISFTAWGLVTLGLAYANRNTELSNG